MFQDCVIYTRVSTKKQVRNGDGLASQMYQCVIYAISNGYWVIATFNDKGFSGSLKERPELNKMLKFLDGLDRTIIICYDSARLTRAEPLIAFELLDKIKQIKCRLEYVTLKIEDGPTANYLQNMSIIKDNLEREQNTEQVNSRMRARINNGYWVFKEKPGYEYKTIHGRCLIPKQPEFNIFQKVILLYVNDEFDTIIEAHQYLLLQDISISLSGFTHMLNDSFIAGIIHSDL